MKKRLFKNGFAMVMSLIMALSLIPMTGAASTLTPDANGLYPDAEYSDESAFDASGKWIYRELVQGGDCEDTSLIWNNGSTSVSAAELDTTIKHSGNASIKQSFSAKNLFMGLPLDEVWVEGDTYRVSYWFYTNTALAKNELKDYLTYARVGKGTNGNVEVKYSTAVTADEWNFIDSTIQFARNANDTSGNIAIDTTKTSYISLVTNKEDTRHLDDMSVRRVPADLESFPSVYAKSVSPSFSRPVVANGDKVTFTYSMDIDPRTVRKENISVNDVKGANISAVSVATNEATRETTLEITMTGMTDGEAYTVSLDEILDPWGREVVGTSEITVYCANVVAGQYTIFDDLDADGKWIYRELVQGGDCEDTSLIWNNGSTSVSAAELDTTIKHSGNASIKQSFSAKNLFMGLPLDEVWVEGDTYRVSYWFYTNTALAKNELKDYLTYARVGKGTNGNVEVKYSTAVTADEWNFIDSTIQFARNANDTSGNIAIDTTKTSYISLVTNKEDTRHLDDMSVRRIPDFAVNQIGKSLSVDGKTVTFTFDKDIDNRMAVAENIVAGDATVSSIAVNTNAITRETTMAVTFEEAVTLDSVSYTEALTDAWGRAINVKEEKLSFDTPVLSDNTFTVSNIENYSGKTVKLAAIIAAYDSTGKCTEVKFDAFTMENNTTKARLSTALEGAATSVKAFVWDMNTLVPYYINQ